MWSRSILQLALLPLPWTLRRRLLNKLFGYSINRTAKIGFSIVIPFEQLEMAPGASIGHANLIRGMDAVTLGPRAQIGHLNWIYGIPGYFHHLAHEPGRVVQLVLEEGAVITTRHLVDCSAAVVLRAGALVAGAHSQIMSHGIDVAHDRQSTRPIEIGRCSMVSTHCVIVGGAVLPADSVLAPGSMLRAGASAERKLYSGVPAVAVRDYDGSEAFFMRYPSGQSTEPVPRPSSSAIEQPQTR